MWTRRLCQQVAELTGGLCGLRTSSIVDLDDDASRVDFYAAIDRYFLGQGQQVIEPLLIIHARCCP